MCRLLGYFGPAITLDELLYKPENSLITQSYDSKEWVEPLNGDGFGVAWYKKSLAEGPAVFKSIQPAWNNKNLHSISRVIKSRCVLAHIRAATGSDVHQSNCHPFRYKQVAMMHNGDIPEFSKVKRKICALLDDEIFNWVKGQTDSEYFFALFVSEMRKNNVEFKDLEKTAEVLITTIKKVILILHETGIQGPMFLNLVLSDGERFLITRYVYHKSVKPHSLYYSTGGHYVCDEEGMLAKEEENSTKEKSFLVASERLTQTNEDWEEVPVNSLMLVQGNSQISVKKI